MCCTLMRRAAQVLVLHTAVAVAGLNRNAVQYVSPGQAQRRPGLAIPITSRYPEGVSYSIRPLQGENRITLHEPRVALRGDAAPLTLGFPMRRLQRPPNTICPTYSCSFTIATPTYTIVSAWAIWTAQRLGQGVVRHGMDGIMRGSLNSGPGCCRHVMIGNPKWLVLQPHDFSRRFRIAYWRNPQRPENR